ncbi:hypothetical protein [Streptomyces griseochromogenes]|uniref:hypothetical protein n=1 Tax=Streptomyces griseochromogenes TaxID=68214 RepID=UPI00379AF03D
MSPATAFVADFVGEPAINLLPGIATADGHALLSDGLRLAHDEHVRAAPGLTHVFDAETGDSLR